MEFLRVADALGELQAISPEVGLRSWHSGTNYEVGLIAFYPRPDDDPRQICHGQRDVVCHALRGAGRLQLDDESVIVEPGTLYHIPAGTPHDFAATGDEPLVLVYTLVTVPSS
jgi:mannose-6-phosphate isomerase-like protein (cupin superfamily)